MKTIFLLLLTTVATAQIGWYESKYTAINISSDPNALISDNTFVIAGELERVETGFYFKAGFEYASLEGDYKYLYNVLGINVKFGYFDTFRWYTGFKSGFAFRGGEYVNFGGEAGLNYDLNNGILLGLRTDYIYRGDWLYWKGDPDFVFSGYLVVIIKI